MTSVLVEEFSMSRSHAAAVGFAVLLAASPAAAQHADFTTPVVSSEPDNVSSSTPHGCAPNMTTDLGACSVGCGGGTQAVQWSDGCGNSGVFSQACNAAACPTPPVSVCPATTLDLYTSLNFYCANTPSPASGSTCKNGYVEWSVPPLNTGVTTGVYTADLRGLGNGMQTEDFSFFVTLYCDPTTSATVFQTYGLDGQTLLTSTSRSNYGGGSGNSLSSDGRTIYSSTSGNLLGGGGSAIAAQLR
jgi:hypothetical protein